MPADDVVQASSAIVQRRQKAAMPKPICLDAAKDNIEGRASDDADRVIQNRTPQPTADPVYTRNLLLLELDAHLPQSASADVVDSRAAVVLSSAGKSARDMIDNSQSSSESPDFTKVPTVRLESGDGDSGREHWLTARCQCLDNQILRLQLRCQRAETLVSEQFNIILKR